MKENFFSTGNWKSRGPLLAKVALEYYPRASRVTSPGLIRKKIEQRNDQMC